jgi:hypothetical protein
MQPSTRHDVDDDYRTRIADPTELRERVHLQFHELQHISSRVSVLQEMSRVLLDHLGARSVDDPGLSQDRGHFDLVLRTAAESADGVLECLMAPEGDQRIPLSWLGGELTNMGEDHDDLNPRFWPTIDLDLTPQVWVEAVELAVVSHRVRDQGRASGAGYRMYASILDDLAGKEAFPAAGLAQMNALSLYLNPARHPLPQDWPEVALRMPSEAERTTAAQALDAAGGLSGEQALLRVLLDDDQERFERALADHLDRYRQGMGAASAPAPRTLLPMGVIALVALAVQVHGWRVDLTSDYLPEVLVRTPAGIPPVQRPAPSAG